MKQNLNIINKLNQDLNAATGTAERTRKIPPLQKWQPNSISPLDIKICSNGEWWHEGTKMTRQSLVDLFASVLWAEYVDGQKVHYLKTPTDKYRIDVADTPLFINQVRQVVDLGLLWVEFETTNGDVIRLDDEHDLYFVEYEGVSRLYIDIRFNLTARLMNNAMYHLVELGEIYQTDTHTHLHITSGGKVHIVSQPNEPSER